MENVVFIIGAGFSAPLGLPVMSNFLEFSKDMYYQHDRDQKYKYFKEVFDKIHDLSYGLNYYKMNLHNIEEILSILDMSSFLGNKRNRNLFSKYIRDVVDYYTPKLNDFNSELLSSPMVTWDNKIFGDNDLFNKYGIFVSHILNIDFHENSIEEFGRRKILLEIKKTDSPKYMYSVVSLNYDLIFENLLSYLLNNYQVETNIKFNKRDYHDIDNDVLLAKLHGSIDINEIVPPTWSKMINKKLNNVWKNAYNALSNANHIIVVGYSLPDTDSYIRYLFKAAVINSTNLKTIDIICLDPKGDVKRNYDSFIDYPYRFINIKTQDYLEYVYKKKHRHQERGNKVVLRCNNLYNIHTDFIESYRKS